jgi:hypothetical protein
VVVLSLSGDVVGGRGVYLVLRLGSSHYLSNAIVIIVAAIASTVSGQA